MLLCGILSDTLNLQSPTSDDQGVFNRLVTRDLVPVRAHYGDFLATDLATAEFHEMVFKQDAQVLPVAKVYFKRN